jgi:hypothetical protein
MAPQQQCPGYPCSYQTSTATQQFELAHEQGLRKKQLFKEYLSRHEVMETINTAMESLFNSSELPHDPLKFLGQALLAASSTSSSSSSSSSSAAAAAATAHGNTGQQHQQR